MGSDSNSNKNLSTSTNNTPTFRWPMRRKFLFRGRRLPIVRLGGTRPPRRGFYIARVLRRARLKWLKLKNSCVLKELKDYYSSLMKDIIEGGGTIDSYQQRLLLETSFAVPVMGISFSGFQ